MKNFKIRFSIVFAMILLMAFPVIADVGFDPGLLVADESFGNYQAFTGPDSIQRFLEQKGSVLANTSLSFLNQLKEPADIDLKNKLEDPNPNLGRLRTAAEIIYDASQVAKINPQVILVTLQKEQSLITGGYQPGAGIQRRLDRAMGFACPDSGVCGDLYLGFYFQLFGNVDNEGNRYLGATRSLSKSFYTEISGKRVGRGPMIDAAGYTFSSQPKVRTSHAGDTITVDNTQGPPNNAPAQQTFVLRNSATATLYRYTPHAYNGNYNFWKYFRMWFKLANGSLIKLSGADAIYYVDNGTRRPVSGTVLGLRHLDVTSAYVITQTEFDEYAEAKPLPPPDGALVAPASSSVKYVVEDSILHPITDFVAGLRKLDLAGTLYIPDNEVATYEKGPSATPPEGTLLRSPTAPVVYLVQSNSIRPISGFVFKQRGFSFSKLIIAPDSEIATYNKSAPLPPLDGTLVKAKGSPLVYYVALGQKYPIAGYVFKLQKFNFKNVVELGADEIENLPVAQHLAPPDGTLVKAKGDGTIYLVEASSLHYITAFMFVRNGYKFKSVVEVTPGELALLPQNSPLSLPDGTLIKIKNDPTVYVLADGKKQPLSYTAFKARNYKFSDVVEMPQVEGDRYPLGDSITQ